MATKTIVGASAAAQLALGVDQSDVQVKRYLRSNLAMLEHHDGDTEDRGIDFLTEAMGRVVEPGVQTALEHASFSISPGIQRTIDNEFRDYVFGRKINTDMNTKDLLKNEQFKEWVKSVGIRFQSNLDAGKVATISTLLSIYGKEIVLDLLAAGKKDKLTKSIAEDLETSLVIKWAAEDEHVDDVIKLVEVGKVGPEVLKSPLLYTWIAHATKMDEEKFELLYKTLSSHYNAEELAKLLVEAKNDVATVKIATKLETVQLESWKTKRKEVIDIFNLLKLSKEDPTTLLTNPVLSTWITYVLMWEKDPYRLLLSRLKRHVDETALDAMFAAAKSDGTNGDIVKTLEYIQTLNVKQLEHPQVLEWWKARKSGEDVFLLLGLDKEGERMFESPLWDTWVSFTTFRENLRLLADRKPVVELTFSALDKRFKGEDLAKLVAKAKTVEATRNFAAGWELNLWWTNGQTADAVFDLLKLKTKEAAVFASPEFKSWASYVKKLNMMKARVMKLDPAARLEANNLELAAQLKKHYEGFNVEQMLMQARKTANENNDEDTSKFIDDMLGPDQ